MHFSISPFTEPPFMVCFLYYRRGLPSSPLPIRAAALTIPFLLLFPPPAATCAIQMRCQDASAWQSLQLSLFADQSFLRPAPRATGSSLPTMRYARRSSHYRLHAHPCLDFSRLADYLVTGPQQCQPLTAAGRATKRASAGLRVALPPPHRRPKRRMRVIFARKTPKGLASPPD